ncbi:MAG: hypothetical protein Q8R55_05980 [Candidatus Taylorbacteria bacterium]|nr:hypothetical protein [Candidatus Taylorbacteria bacterium]
MKIPNLSQKGFTLIEMIFYMLFITLIIGGSFGIIYQLLRNSDSLKSGIAIEEEANFILKKIIWTLNDINTVNSPAVNGTAVFLSVDKNDFAANNPVVIDMDSGDIRLKRGLNPALALNTDRFEVTDLNFELVREGSDPDTDLLKVSLILDGKAFKLTWHIR